jgi:hypothetical protein
MIDNKQCQLWKKDIRQWMEDNIKDYSVEKTPLIDVLNRMVDDAIDVIGNPCNIDSSELLDIAMSVLEPGY